MGQQPGRVRKGRPRSRFREVARQRDKEGVHRSRRYIAAQRVVGQDSFGIQSITVDPDEQPDQVNPRRGDDLPVTARNLVVLSQKKVVLTHVEVDRRLTSRQRPPVFLEVRQRTDWSRHCSDTRSGLAAVSPSARRRQKEKFRSMSAVVSR